MLWQLSITSNPALHKSSLYLKSDYSSKQHSGLALYAWMQCVNKHWKRKLSKWICCYSLHNQLSQPEPFIQIPSHISYLVNELMLWWIKKQTFVMEQKFPYFCPILYNVLILQPTCKPITMDAGGDKYSELPVNETQIISFKCWLVMSECMKFEQSCTMNQRHMRCSDCDQTNPMCEPLTHLPLDKMAAISQMTFSNAFSWMKMYWYQLKFHWSCFLMVQLVIFQH